MPCDHLQPQDLMTMAEEWLRERAVPGERWGGVRVRHGENTPQGMWASVLMELERRDGEWIVTRLDRNREPLPESDCGLVVVV